MKETDPISVIYLQEVEKFLNEQYENDQPDSLSEEELTQIWTEISDETDIEDVWNKIHRRKDTPGS